MAKTIQLYSTVTGDMADFEVEVDQNGEIIATHKLKDQADEILKFPAGLSKTEFNKLISQHNKANAGTVARDPAEVDAEQEARLKSQRLIEGL